MTQVSSAQRGMLFGRFCKSLLIAKGDVMAAIGYAQGQGPGWSEVVEGLKAQVNPLASDAAALTYPIAADFIELLRPMTIVGRMSGLTPVPFNTRMIGVAAGTSASWVGEGSPKPVSAMDFDAVGSLAFAKVSAIGVVTDELVRSSNPSAAAIIGRDVAAACAYELDRAFVDWDGAGSAALPAGITYGASATVSTGPSIAQVDADLKAVIGVLTAADVDLSSAYWLMNPRTATSLSLLRGSGGAPAYPNVGPRGGTLLQMPVLCSRAVTDVNSPSETSIVLVAASEIALADDGAARVEVSRSASIEMSDAPTASPGPTTQAVVSLWQNGLAAIRAERTIRWAMRRAAACAYISQVQF